MSVTDRVEQAEARLDLVGGSRWLRSSGYYIECGMIRLRPGAELEIYDPWEEWREAADEDRPYKRLLRLAQQLHPPRLYGPLPKREQQLLEKWVQENGLLGILPHETIEAHFAPRWVDAQEFEDKRPPGASAERSFVAAQREQLWTGLHWPVYLKRLGEVRSAAPDLEGKPVSPKELGGAGLPTEVLRRRVQDARMERRSLADHYHGFFPDVPQAEASTYAYPGADTDGFWRGYAESAWQFVHAARYLAAPLEALPRMHGSRLDDDDRILIQRALERIDAIASVVDYAGVLTNENELMVGMSSPSLLGMYAFMLLTDLKARHEVKRCPNCEALFLAKNRRARYCSSTCRHAQQKREWRKARAAKREDSEASTGDS
jgi:hypothetical protein